MIDIAPLSYVDNKEYEKINGWNSHGAFQALRLIDAFQKSHKIKGSMCEIGVHHGQFFVAMALGIQLSQLECCIAIDVFDKQELNVDDSGCGDIRLFAKNLRKYDIKSKVTVISKSSLEVRPEEICPRKKVYNSMPVRIFHIDGGHTVVHVMNDLFLAERVCHPAGVVVVDDFLHPKWPGVTEGINRYFLQVVHNFILFPFAYGNNKIYLSRYEWRDKYMELFGLAFPGCERKLVKLWGFNVYWVNYN